MRPYFSQFCPIFAFLGHFLRFFGIFEHFLVILGLFFTIFSIFQGSPETDPCLDPAGACDTLFRLILDER